MTTFMEFLQEKCASENPNIKDDNMPDAFDHWLGEVINQDVEILIRHADEWRDKEDLAAYNKKSKYNKDHE